VVVVVAVVVVAAAVNSCLDSSCHCYHSYPIVPTENCSSEFHCTSIVQNGKQKSTFSKVNKPDNCFLHRTSNEK